MARKEAKKHEKRVEAIDTKWFQDRMGELGLDRDRVARAFDVAPYMVTRMVHGERAIRLAEIATWAHVLECHPAEIVRRLGVPMPVPSVPVVGILRGTGRVSPFPPGRSEKIESPRLEPGALAAVRIDSTNSALALHHGGYLYFEPTEVVAPGAFGRLSVIELGDVPAPVVGVLDRGASIRGGRVVVLGAQDAIESDQLQSAAPILWTKSG